ncbi:MAG: anti-sigma factor antagonist [Planctomycetota bacterium]
MSTFQYQAREIKAPGGASAVLVELSGSVDPSTIDAFQEMLDKLLESKAPNVVMDLRNINYINSTGFEKMVQEVDFLAKKGGRAVLLHPSAKVVLLMEMLGIRQFFHVAEDVDAALAAVAWKATPAPVVQMRLKEPGIKTAREPYALSCGGCGVTLTVPGAGRYRCPHCRAFLTVDDSLSVKTYAETDASSIEVVIPADEECVGALRLLLTIGATRVGLNGEATTAVSDAVEVCGRILIQEALSNRPTERLHVFVGFERPLLSVRLFAAGKPLGLSGRNPAQREEVLAVAGRVDRLAFESPGIGNLFVIEKRSASSR